MKNKLRVFLVDDELLATERLERLLEEIGKIEIVGITNNPFEALKKIPQLELDAIFLDIQMPELTGFELLQKLEKYPPVIFTTAFDEFALQAFEVHSIDYLLKPIQSERLEKSIDKLESATAKSRSDEIENLQNLIKNLSNIKELKETLKRIPSRVGTKIQILNTEEITHFFAEDKLTFAHIKSGKNFIVDFTLLELEERLDSDTFLRVHRNSIVNLNFVKEIHKWFSGEVLIRLTDSENLEIAVSRRRVKHLQKKLSI